VALEPSDGSAPGWLRAVVSANGLIRMSGRLPNGSMVTANQGIIVNRHGETMVFLTGQAGRSSLLAGRVYFEDLAASDVSGALTFNGAPCNASGSRFKLSTSGLPPGAYPLALTGTGVNIATTVTLRANNSARVLPPMASFVPSPAPFSPATGVFQLAFRNPASPFGPLLKGSGVFHQKLGIGMGQFKAAGATGRVELGPITSP
jgi:hypothetical protein